MSRESLKIKKVHKNPTGGLSEKGRKYINSKTGSKLKRPVTKKSGLSKSEKGRKKSYCARSEGQKKKFPKAAKNPESRLMKARRKWNCN